MRNIYITLIFMLTTNMLMSQEAIWFNTYGGSGMEYAYDVIETLDGNILVYGYTSSNDGDVSDNNGEFDLWLLKINSIDGSIISQKNLGGSLSDLGEGTILQAEDGSIYVSGSSQSNNGDTSVNYGISDFWVLKLDENLEIIWQKNFGGSGDDSVQDMIYTSDNNLLIVGYSESDDYDLTPNNGYEDYWVVKIDLSGNLIWEKTFGSSNQDIAYSVCESSNEDYYIIGQSSVIGDEDISEPIGLGDYWVVVLNQNGDFISEHSFGGSSNDIGLDILPYNENFIAIGNSESMDADLSNNNGEDDIWLVHFDNDYNILWETSIGGSLNEGGLDMIIDNNQNIILAGGSNSSDGDFGINNGGIDAWLVSLSNSGEINWTFNAGGSDIDIFNSVLQTNEGNIIAVGYTYSTDGDIPENLGESDFFVVKLDVENLDTNDFNGEKNTLIYPNPTDSYFQIDAKEIIHKIEFFSFDNKLVKTIFNPDPKIDVSDISPGVYFLRMYTNSGIVNKKLVIK